MRLISDILSVVLDEGEVSKITLLHRANLDSRLLNKYFNLLNDAGLIEVDNRKGKMLIRITDKGIKFIIRYKELRYMINGKAHSTDDKAGII